MKYMNKARKFASKVKTQAAVGSLLLMASAGARAEGADDIWAAIDLTGTTTKVVGAGVVIIGIAMAIKTIGLGKRTVNKI
ncbi:Phage coat protein [Vibrio crassostreae]|uniref:phage coat protein n=1 Tax=Vibrio crassostreae TaxID=246167 RepID=UPI001BD1EE4E|nr:phage coat protein [Vibrio crassostreae]CAK2011799.1 Phage coat protein [Vibrio crassostreae]CAK2040977.1 Phage coat protein [Vibrio crassostreae]CAK2299415.1 Phage coat protein [Vibrio crassostreae]CAK2345556.1 Phage coat protein [Vibrio crassostreae]CAK2350342.1 Phage coat protein [Vibrio crassostreae]